MSLSLPGKRLGTVESRSRREQAILESKTWPAPAKRTRFYPLYDHSDGLRQGARVGATKPGKETNPKRKYPNPFDMTPTAKLGGKLRPFDAGFGDVFRALYDLGASTVHQPQEPAARDVGALIFRNAWMLDHVSKAGVLRYGPPVASTGLSTLPPIRVQSSSGPFDVSATELLFLLEVLALNEDVKYWYRSGARNLNRKVRGRTGRPSTLLSCSRALSCGLGDEHPMKFAYDLTKGRGVASLNLASALARFPSLA
jgi:hypothetical protein